MSHFGINGGKGFHMTFRNGWCISVQFGWGNYCRNKDGGEFQHLDFGIRDRKLGEQGCNNAEVAVFDATGEMVKLPAFMFEGEDDRDIVSGWNTTDKVLELMNWAAAQPPKEAA